MVIVKFKPLIFIYLTLLPSLSIASDLIYKPVNPSFGGNPLNGSFLLSKAQAQNTHKAPVVQQSYADRFQASLERAYINKLVREITDLSFGETCDPADTTCEPSLLDQDSIFTSGDHIIEVITTNADTITISVTNSVTGEITIIEIPRFG
ncbi:curli assembly protein CsgF [Psychrosphaera sp.]|nr:curli assembly protein CsgF [Psychrosphaera sp.]